MSKVVQESAATLSYREAPYNIPWLSVYNDWILIFGQTVPLMNFIGNRIKKKFH